MQLAEQDAGPEKKTPWWRWPQTGLWVLVTFLLAPHRLIPWRTYPGVGTLFNPFRTRTVEEQRVINTGGAAVLILVGSAVLWGLLALVVYALNPALIIDLMSKIDFPYRQLFDVPLLAVLITGAAQFVAWVVRETILYKKPGDSGRTIVQRLSAVFEKLGLFLSFLLFDPRMLAGWLGDANKTQGELSRRILVARIVNVLVWSGMILAIGFMPVVNSYFSLFFAWMGAGSGSFIFPIMLGLIGGFVAACGQAISVAWEEKEGSKAGSVIYSLLLAPRRGTMGENSVKRVAYSLLNIGIWVGAGLLVAFSFPNAWDVLGQGFMPLLAGLGAVIGQVWSWGRDNVELRGMTNYAFERIPVAEDHSEEFLYEYRDTPANDFLQRSWYESQEEKFQAQSGKGQIRDTLFPNVNKYTVGFFDPASAASSASAQEVGQAEEAKSQPIRTAPTTGIAFLCQ